MATPNPRIRCWYCGRPTRADARRWYGEYFAFCGARHLDAYLREVYSHTDPGPYRT